MKNKVIIKRLEGIRSNLVALHAAGSSLTSASRGVEREHFLNTFLCEVFPLPYRFGSGDITDLQGRQSRQCDIVVEYPFLPSLPFFSGGPRLYLAEGVAAVIEVKSNLNNQWDEVEKSAKALKKLERLLEEEPEIQIGELSKDIPFFAVGYKGWRNIETVRDHVKSLDIDGVLVVDPCLYVSNKRFADPVELAGPEALWGFITSISQASTCIRLMDFDPNKYIRSA